MFDDEHFDNVLQETCCKSKTIIMERAILPYMPYDLLARIGKSSTFAGALMRGTCRELRARVDNEHGTLRNSDSASGYFIILLRTWNPSCTGSDRDKSLRQLHDVWSAGMNSADTDVHLAAAMYAPTEYLRNLLMIDGQFLDSFREDDSTSRGAAMRRAVWRNPNYGVRAMWIMYQLGFEDIGLAGLVPSWEP